MRRAPRQSQRAAGWGTYWVPAVFQYGSLGDEFGRANSGCPTRGRWTVGLGGHWSATGGLWPASVVCSIKLGERNGLHTVNRRTGLLFRPTHDRQRLAKTLRHPLGHRQADRQQGGCHEPQQDDQPQRVREVRISPDAGRQRREHRQDRRRRGIREAESEQMFHGGLDSWGELLACPSKMRIPRTGTLAACPTRFTSSSDSPTASAIRRVPAR